MTTKRHSSKRQLPHEAHTIGMKAILFGNNNKKAFELNCIHVPDSELFLHQNFFEEEIFLLNFTANNIELLREY